MVSLAIIIIFAVQVSSSFTDSKVSTVSSLAMTL